MATQPAQSADDPYASYAQQQPTANDPYAPYANQTSTSSATASPSLGQRWENYTAPVTQMEPSNKRPGILGHVETGVGNIGAGGLNLLLHPYDAAKGTVRLLDAVSSPDGWNAPNNPVKETIASFRQDPAANLEYMAGATAAGLGTEKTISNIPRIASSIYPSPSEDIVAPTEMAARRLTKAVVPPNKDAAQFLAAAPLEVPNIVQYARETNNPLKTQLEFGKAAQGNATKVRGYYENQILGPNDRTVSVAGTGYEGPTVGEGQNARLSAIDRRIIQINKELSGPSAKINAGDARAALASKTGLQNEAANLTRILHENLAQSTGLQPEDIANVRQRVGRSYQLANDTDASILSRAQGEGRAAQGTLHPQQIPVRMWEWLRGGPNVIADRVFQRAIKNYPGEPTPLPIMASPEMSAASRVPIWNDIQESSRPMMGSYSPDTEGAKALMEKRLSPRREAIAGRLATRAKNLASHGKIGQS